MFALTDLRVPLIVAPMAGGPSTPALVAAAAGAGAMGFLAGGYKSVDAVDAEIASVRSLLDGPFGVNLFVPGPPHPQIAGQPEANALAAYRAELSTEAARYGVDLPATDPSDTDAWAEKVDLLLARRVPVVSFTFGMPGPDTVDRFHAAGTHVTITVTDPDEAAAAAATGADSLCVQGPGGGGHRGTHRVDKTPDERDLGRLLGDVRQVAAVPLIATGGVGTAATIAELIGLGAAAVQLGTLFIAAPESGASPAYKRALVSGAYAGTTVTRAFSGRLARGLTNRFIREHDGHAPAAYPMVNQLTRVLRAAAASAGDAEGLALFAGTGFAHCTPLPAAEVLRTLWRDTQERLASGAGG